MSRAPRKARSFEAITAEDLSRLASLGLAQIELAFLRRPEKRALYQGKLLGLCLCQGAADHYLRPGAAESRGVHDFDLWGFYRAQPGGSFWNRSASRADFGASKFGRSPLDSPKYIGRRVDVFWRSIPAEEDGPAIAAIARYFAAATSKSAIALRKKSAVMIWPAADLGQVVWAPRQN
jgi:hypothetical protein